MAKGLLFAAVGEPVVHPNFSDQVGAESSKLGRRHSPLDALGPDTATLLLKAYTVTDTRQDEKLTTTVSGFTVCNTTNLNVNVINTR